MNIKIKDKVGLDVKSIQMLIDSFLKNRQPKEGSFDYTLETHGAIGITFGYNLKFPIQVLQTNKRKSEKSPIEITIEKHTPF